MKAVIDLDKWAEIPWVRRVALVVTWLGIMIFTLFAGGMLMMWQRPIHMLALLIAVDIAFRGSWIWERRKLPALIGVAAMALCLLFTFVAFVPHQSDSLSLQAKPVLYGMLGGRSEALADRGEAILGGCVVGPIKWVLFIGGPWGPDLDIDKITCVWDLPPGPVVRMLRGIFKPPNS